MTAVPSTTSPTFWTSTCSGWATCTTARTLPAGVVPWSLPLEDRALLVAAYGRTNLTMRQLAPLFGVSKSVEARTRKRFAKDTVLIVDGTLVPTHDHTIAAQSKNYRYSTNHQGVIDADTRLVVVVGRSLAGNRNDCKAWEESGAKAAVGKTLTIADGGYPGTGLLIPHRRERGQIELPDWKEEHKRSHKRVRARVEHVFARMNLTLAGQRNASQRVRPPPRPHGGHIRDSP